MRSLPLPDAVGELVAYLRAVRDWDGGQLDRRDELGALRLREGGSVLDVGCGAGDDVRTLAAVVGPAGTAVGVDACASLIAEAAKTPGGRFVRADAHALPFPDGGFDAVRCERVLQHVRDPARVLAEMARVAAPGGIVAVSEPDWDTLVIDLEPATVTNRIVRAFRGLLRNPVVGRQTARLMAGAGLAPEAAIGDALVFRDAGEARRLLLLDEAAANAVRRGMPRSVAAAWLAELERRGAEGTFFAAATGFFVTARKPG